MRDSLSLILLVSTCNIARLDPTLEPNNASALDMTYLVYETLVASRSCLKIQAVISVDLARRARSRLISVCVSTCNIARLDPTLEPNNASALDMTYLVVTHTEMSLDRALRAKSTLMTA
jgi:hypothetical protein